MLTSSTFRCIWKIFQKLSAPIRNMLIDLIVLVLVEFIKFSMILLLMFVISYSILYIWSKYNERQQYIVSSITSERLSDGLMDSFSKYPYIVEVPSKLSAESLKLNRKKQVQ
ncbi:uncharacterized protein LOC124419563 [Lucilia cuprina]|uniref:uncharacterized protein LOC124419563 n=1 Tax=Lucilia cuprina TaxID=7375 RepID=UPI001F05D17A|nr:uncharacterized protein LOC124419563 [Lucilia cuprina]